MFSLLREAWLRDVCILLAILTETFGNRRPLPTVSAMLHGSLRHLAEKYPAFCLFRRVPYQATPLSLRLILFKCCVFDAGKAQSIATELRAGRCRVRTPGEARDFSPLQSVRICSEVHPELIQCVPGVLPVG